MRQDLFEKNIGFHPDDFVTPWFREIVKLRVTQARQFVRWTWEEMKPVVPEPESAELVLSEVTSTLDLSRLAYRTRDGEDGTPEMYAADVINRLRKVYDLPL